jgi:hypothetical protein
MAGKHGIFDEQMKEDFKQQRCVACYILCDKDNRYKIKGKLGMRKFDKQIHKRK